MIINNPYEKMLKQAEQAGQLGSTARNVLQLQTDAYEKGYMKRAEEIRGLKAEVKAWIKEVRALERKGKQLIDKLYQLEKDWVLEVIKEENSKHK